MMATRAMSASSSSAAARHKRRQRAGSHVTFEDQPKKVKKPSTKLTPDLCYLLLKKLAPRLMIGIGIGFIFLGILLACLGFTASRHYPEGKGAGLTLLILGIFALAGGITWRVWRLRYRSQKAKNDLSQSQSERKGSAAKYETNNAALSVTDIRISAATDVASLGTVVEETNELRDDNSARKTRPKKINNNNQNIPEIEVSYIDCDNGTAVKSSEL